MIMLLKCFNSFLLIFSFDSFFYYYYYYYYYYYLLPSDEDNYLSKALVIVLHCFFVFRHLCEYITLDVFDLLISFTIILFHRNADV